MCPNIMLELAPCQTQTRHFFYCFRLLTWFGNIQKQITSPGSSILHTKMNKLVLLNLTSHFLVLVKWTRSGINQYLLKRSNIWGSFSSEPSASRSFKRWSPVALLALSPTPAAPRNATEHSVDFAPSFPVVTLWHWLFFPSSKGPHPG